jgi:type III secretory pathway lipoprotein EscJ
MDLLEEKEIIKKIKDPTNNEFTSSDLELFTEDDIINSTDEEKQKYIKYYENNIEKELDDLNKKLKQK